MSDNPFARPEVVDLWESTTELVGDAALARKVMEHLAHGYWNMPWATWQELASRTYEQASRT